MVDIPESMKMVPETICIQKNGKIVASASPISTLSPSTIRNASMAPMKTVVRDHLEHRVITVIWVLSPSSAIKTRRNDAKSGNRFMG